MAPVLQFNCSFVFSSSGEDFTLRLPDVFLARARTFKAVDPVLFVFGGSPFVFGTKDILQFGTWFKCNAASCFPTNPLELVGYTSGYVGDGNKRLFLTLGRGGRLLLLLLLLLLPDLALLLSFLFTGLGGVIGGNN